MKRKGMPKNMNSRPTADVRFDISTGALNKWDAGIKAAASDDANTINIFDVIGEDYWTGEGWTATRVAGLLRYIGADQDITVNINSPGGDMFEGLAIYNLLRDHKGTVTTRVLGVAASAASVIAAGGDKIEIARAGFFMIHNAWIMVAGNRNDLRSYADYLEPFDKAMADIYAARTGKSIEEMSALMDAESWIGGSEAIDIGLADSLLAADEVLRDDSAVASAAARLDRALAKTGMPRTERRKLLQEVKGTPSAAEPDEDMPSAVSEDLSNLFSQLRDVLK